MKITYVGYPGLTDGIVSTITEDKQEAIAHAGPEGTVVRIVTVDDSVRMCAIFKGEGEFPWL